MQFLLSFHEEADSQNYNILFCQGVSPKQKLSQHTETELWLHNLAAERVVDRKYVTDF
jgi:hypothetical protein